MSTENLLVEIGTEELPPKSLRSLSLAFKENVEAELNKLELEYDQVRSYASPRRLAVYVTQLASAQRDKTVEKRGPSISAAFDKEGNPTKAAEGWARSNGIAIDRAERLKTEKGEWLLHRAKVRGKSIAELVPGLAQRALSRLPIPKPMRWGASDIEFIRPVKTATLMYGAELLPGKLLGCESGRDLQGHRFHCKGKVQLDHADNYLQTLKQQGHVIADFETRKLMIRAQVEAAARKEEGVAEIDGDLLDEVTALVEWPVTLVGGFEDKFLQVPSEALIYTMKDNQKYFPMLDREGKLMNRFIFVSNIVSNDPAKVIEGNEKVIRPRLADAEFFFNTDKKRRLEHRVDSLSNVLFEKQLGTLKEKSERIAALAGEIGDLIQAPRDLSARAGILSKTDLMTEMVMEFPDVQGVMGMYYARNDGENEEVAIALHEQYKPRFSGDSLPSSPISCAVAIADKLDTLVGIFGIGRHPKGDKDPFALRRAALGVLRIIVENKLPLDLVNLIALAQQEYGDKLSNPTVAEDVLQFFLARFRTWYLDEGYPVDVIQAVLARRPTQPADFDQRMRAVTHFRDREEAAALATANKRVSNILTKQAGLVIGEELDVALLKQEEEKELANALQHMQKELAPVIEQGDYQSALDMLASLRDLVDAFFDNVMVMDEDQRIRENRLVILNQLRTLFLRIADISLLKT
jgi:glycyl-tRNA synthetase beta chain